MYPTLAEVPTHGLFVALGIAVAALVFTVEARRRGATDERMLYIVMGALLGGAIFMRLGTWAQHLDPSANASLVEQWVRGNRSILGGLVGAWLGVHVAKWVVGYRARTGDLFAPAVAAGMAVGRIGCYLSESPAGRSLHWTFLAESAFHAVAFVALWWWLRHRDLPPGETFVWYVAAYGLFRFGIEFWRGNEVAWQGLTRPQLFLAVTIPFVLARIWWRWRRDVETTAPTTQEVPA